MPGKRHSKLLVSYRALGALLSVPSRFAFGILYNCEVPSGLVTNPAYSTYFDCMDIYGPFSSGGQK